MTKLLIADDDIEFCQLLSEYLGGQGYAVVTAHDGEEALARAADSGAEAMVLDVMMPKKDGFTVLRELRAKSNLPVLMLTARGDDIDRIVGLEMGADDYLPKPCNPRELAARLSAILRRTASPENHKGTEPLAVEDCRLELAAREVWLGSDVIALTSAEFDVLHILMLHAGEVVDKNALSEQALQRPLGAYDRSLDVHVSNIRRKLGDAADGRERIKTVRNRGYQYRVVG